MSRRRTGSSPAKPAPRRWWRRWGWSAPAWRDYALAIGMDTAQGRPGDALEYTAAAGGAAFLLGPAEESLAVIECSYSYVTDTPDFWRREYQRYPEHGQRFTGEPAYFKHITEARQSSDGSHWHDRRGLPVCRFPPAQYQVPPAGGRPAGLYQGADRSPGCLSPVIGNTYAGAAMIGLTAMLDIAKPGDRILMVSFGSGAGSDAFDIRGDRCDQRAPRLALPRRRITSPGAPRSITAPMSATAASWR